MSEREKKPEITRTCSYNYILVSHVQCTVRISESICALEVSFIFVRFLHISDISGNNLHCFYPQDLIKFDKHFALGKEGLELKIETTALSKFLYATASSGPTTHKGLLRQFTLKYKGTLSPQAASTTAQLLLLTATTGSEEYFEHEALFAENPDKQAASREKHLVSPR